MASKNLGSLESPDSYTVSWIAALPIERAAAKAMLDEEHAEPKGLIRHPSDTNVYTWGRIGDHNVVIASLAAGIYGLTSTATTVSSLSASLPSFRIELLIGIGGAISRPHNGRDIPLGDVIISQPDGTTGGVCQYDLVKSKPGDRRERKGFLAMPPTVLLKALVSIQADHEIEDARIPDILQDMLQANHKMANRSKQSPGYVHQGTDNDLFQSSYEHVSIVRLLLKNHADVNSTRPNKHGSALNATCKQDHLEIVNVLLDEGADINPQGRSVGINFLSSACTNGHLDVVKLLSDRGARFKCDAERAPYDANYDDALKSASANGHEEVAQFLPGNRENAGFRGYDASTSIQAGCYDDACSSALSDAANGVHEIVVKMLLDVGANVNARDWKYSTPLNAACKRSHEKIVKVLLDHGADSNANPDRDRNLYKSICLRTHEVFKLPVAHGASLCSLVDDYQVRLNGCFKDGDLRGIGTLLDLATDAASLSSDFDSLLQAAASSFCALSVHEATDVKDQDETHQLIAAALIDESSATTLIDFWYYF